MPRAEARQGHAPAATQIWQELPSAKAAESTREVPKVGAGT